MLQKLNTSLVWFEGNMLIALIASFIIVGVLIVFNRRAEITKTIYRVDCKATNLNKV
jgi:hypothetical protein